MIHKVTADLTNLKKMTLELDDTIAPKTVRSFLACLPLEVGINVWGEEIYTDKIPVDVGEENSKSLVNRMDIAYWPPGKALCLFFGPTPIGKEGEIRPYSPVNVMGRIKETEKIFIKSILDGMTARFYI